MNNEGLLRFVSYPHRYSIRLYVYLYRAGRYDLYNGMLPIFVDPLKALVKQKLPSDKYAPDVTCPVLIIASLDDEMVSLRKALLTAKCRLSLRAWL